MTQSVINKPETKVVDIIIPVYRGYDETLACIDSALNSRSQNGTKMNIIVINDAGPDPELTEALIKRAQMGEFSLYHNEVNKGFVGTVNLGMTMTQNDVVLLNSDAVVANNWLDKLVKHAQSTDYSGKIASVTPFSNNATICSYPVFCAQNPLPAGETVASMDEFCAQANAGLSIELPTGVGFCMYITRAALTELGLFDETAFGRGYGEENDFCARAIKAGYHNLFALDTFAMHEGGVSFAETQLSLQQHASRALSEKHPEYDAWVADHVFHNPALVARTRIDLLRFSHSSLPLVLCILHAHGGGTEKHVEDLAMALTGEANILALKANENGQLYLFAPAQSEAFSLMFKRRQMPELLRLLTLLNISRVHFHHLLGVDAELIRLPKTLGVPYDFTAHDYFTINANVHLLGNDMRQDDAQVAKMQAFLLGASRLFAPSVDTCSRLNSAFPTVTFHAVAHPDCIIDKPKLSLDAQPDDLPLRILLIGGLGVEKGADVLSQAIAYVKQHALPIQFHLLGYTYHGLTTSANAMVYGPFKQSDLAELIGKVNPHWIWFPAQTPETYSYTLSAAMATTCPILASDLGALAERLATYPKARLLPWDSHVADWCDAMQAMKFDAPRTEVKQAEAFSVASYMAMIRRNPAPLNTEILDFAQFAQSNDNYQFEWSLHGVKIVILKGLVRIKHQSMIARLMRRIPVGVQLRVKNWLLGAK